MSCNAYRAARRLAFNRFSEDVGVESWQRIKRLEWDIWFGPFYFRDAEWNACDGEEEGAVPYDIGVEIDHVWDLIEYQGTIWVCLDTDEVTDERPSDEDLMDWEWWRFRDALDLLPSGIRQVLR